jgi:hypothetical protein
MIVVPYSPPFSSYRELLITCTQKNILKEQSGLSQRLRNPNGTVLNDIAMELYLAVVQVSCIGNQINVNIPVGILKEQSIGNRIL